MSCGCFFYLLLDVITIGVISVLRYLLLSSARLPWPLCTFHSLAFFFLFFSTGADRTPLASSLTNAHTLLAALLSVSLYTSLPFPHAFFLTPLPFFFTLALAALLLSSPSLLSILLSSLSPLSPSLLIYWVVILLAWLC